MDKLTLSNTDILKYAEQVQFRNYKTANSSNPQEVGVALLTIKNNNLYRSVANNFYDYCLIRFGIFPDMVDNYLNCANTNTPQKIENKTGSKQSNSVVYFLLSGDLIKIGFTKDINLRISTIANMSSLPVKLLGYFMEINKTRKISMINFPLSAIMANGSRRLWKLLIS